MDRQELRAELASWIEAHLQDLSPSGLSELDMPVVDDFVLGVALTSATDGPGEGVSVILHLSSANACYRTSGLAHALCKAFEQPTDTD